jgi:hypothetical protein
MLTPTQPMSSTERVREFRKRHGLARPTLLGGLAWSGVRTPAPRARRARKARPQIVLAVQMERAAPPAALPLSPPAAPPAPAPAPAVTVEIPGMNMTPAIAAPLPLPMSERATIPPSAAKSIAA